MLWQKISHLGINQLTKVSPWDEKRLIFFNQVLFIGFFATLFQIIFVWPFIGAKSFLFLIVCAGLMSNLVLNSKGYFKQSKWLYLICLHSMGILTTLLLGGAALYHIQAVLIFGSTLLIFNFRKELPQILFGLPLITISILIGEFGLFGTPDFTDHPWSQVARFANISSLISVNSIFIIVIIRINSKYEKELSNALNEISEKTNELEIGKANLERIVQQRTEKLIQQKETLERQNQEKIVLLKEVHHRVRNNLQIIISLINLQKSKINNLQSKKALSEIQGRVQSMSLVHQKMYQTDNLQNIELYNYTESIVQNISNLYVSADFDYSIEIPQNYKLNLEAAVPFGLIINEIVTNLFKHSIEPSSHRINFKVLLTPGSNATTKLLFSDNGLGFPDGFNVNQSDSLGLQLIKNLVEQLDGTFKMFNDNGANYEITVPKDLF